MGVYCTDTGSAPATGQTFGQAVLRPAPGHEEQDAKLGRSVKVGSGFVRRRGTVESRPPLDSGRTPSLPQGSLPSLIESFR